MQKKITLIIFLFCIISLKILSQSFPCSSAIKLTNITNYCSNNGDYTNVPALTGTTTVAACWTANPSQDVWLTFTATQTDVLISVNGNGSGGGTINNPSVALYTGPCTATLNEIGCSNGTSGTTQLYKGGLLPGTTYLIRISTTAANKGTFKLCVNNYTPTLNPGADCGGAAYICNKNPISVSGLSGGGTNNMEPELTTCAAGTVETNSCWYTFTCQKSGTLTFDLVPTNLSNDIDYILYKLGGTNVCGSRTPIRCNFSSCINSNGSTGLNAPSTDSSVVGGCNPPQNSYCKQVNLVAGVSYALFINNFSNASGFTINWGGTSTFLGPTPYIVASDTTICAGQTVTFNGSTSTNWTNLNWNFSSGGSPTSATGVGPHTVTYTTPGAYVAILEGVSVGGCKTVTSINVIVSPIPSVTITPPATLSCTATSIQLTANSTSLPVNFIWAGPGMVSDGNTATVTINSPGTYTVTVKNAAGCSSSASVTVVSSGSTTTSATGSIISCYGIADGTATSTTTGGTAPFTYSWNTVPVQTTQNATGLSAGTYVITVKDKMGCTSNATVIISEPLAINLVTGKTDANCGGANGSASVTANGGTGSYLYSWNTIPVQTNATATGLIANAYEVSVTDSKGCTQTAAINVVDIGSPMLSTNKLDVSCNGSANGTITTTVTGGIAPYSYAWSNSATTSDISGLTAGTYTLTITGSNNCKATAIVTITEPTLLVITASGIDASCGAANGSATVTATGGVSPYTYSWSTSPVQTTANVSNLASGTYTITVTDFNGCTGMATVNINNIGSPTLTTSFTNVDCFGQNNGTATVNASGGVAPYLYSWNTNPLQTSATATGLKAGTYIVTVTAANGCKVFTTVTITEPPAILLTKLSTDENCGKSNGTVSVSATGGTPPYTYLWSSSPVQNTAIATGLKAGNYTAIVADSKGCSQSISVSVINIPGPIANFAFASACVNTLVSFTNTSSTGAILWTWNFGDGTSSSLKDPSKAYITSGTYPVKLIIADKLNCKDSVIKNVDVYPLPVVLFGDSTVGCSPLTVSFINNSNPVLGSTYLWDFGDNYTSTKQAPVHIYENGTQSSISYNIKLTVTSVNGCKSTLTKNKLVTVYPNPTALFTASPGVTDIITPTINFYNKSTGNKNNVWTFGDGDSSFVVDPLHTYKIPQEYDVCLNIKNEYGCTSKYCSTIIINPTWSFYIPNAFTPNGDSKNDKFRGYGENILEYQMLIFDRWGNKIFEANNISEAWDGKANGGSAIAQQDVYVYVVVLKDVFKMKHRYTGKVTLVK